jgi:Icc-related predicted phosphoesterase
MKLHILSDLHIEFGNFEMPVTNADVVVLAGDIHVGTKGIEWATEAIKGKDVIYIIGNHEYYRGALPKVTDKIRAIAEDTNIHVLENDAITIGNVKFLGCTLWSDFHLLKNLDVSVNTAAEKMNDYTLVRLSPTFRRLKPSDTAIIHRNSRGWLEKQINSNTDAGIKTVVVTHHAPSIQSVPERYKKDYLAAAFASSMEHFISDSQIVLWVHGHIHDPSDYKINNTRVVCNPRGYVGEIHPGFIPEFTIDL